MTVVSFMIAIPSLRRRPVAGGLTPATNATAPIGHLLPDFFEKLFRAPVAGDPNRRAFDIGAPTMSRSQGSPAATTGSRRPDHFETTLPSPVEEPIRKREERRRG
ncbi:hypothetical protein ACFZBU_24880 [Embleya sp. NPDC008237]|uniref:hypothetical protein n=1 Tax=Embleya sp. NPDC008237 TaxID=3363978 RepID=UPI0036F0C8FF